MNNNNQYPKKLTLEQAIRIRNDFSYLEDEVVGSEDDLELEINRIIVGPYDQEKFGEFLETYRNNDFESRDDEEDLAASLNPDSYNVYTLYHEVGGVFIRENIFETLERLDKEISLSKYKIS